MDKALVTFRNFMADKEVEWFQKNLKDAKALLIVPNLLKAGFILGGSGGERGARGADIVRHIGGTLAWGSRAF